VVAIGLEAVITITLFMFNSSSAAAAHIATAYAAAFDCSAECALSKQQPQ
jgi:hypothetical protein